VGGLSPREDTPTKPRAEMTRGERNVDWIERRCYVPEGIRVGKAVKLMPWQRDEILRIYDNPVGTRRAILSVGRKNGKTTLASCLVLLHLCGPEARYKPNSQIYSAAQSREQAALVYALAAKMVRMNPDLAQAVQILEGTKTLLCLELGIRYRALSAEATTAYGLSPALIVHDELGQVRGPRSTLYEALETATGAQEEPLSIVISTQAPTDQDLLSILIDDALAGHDPHTIVRLFTAPVTLDPFTESTIKLANPAYGDFLSAKEVRAMAEDARRMPAREAEYRNLILNQRVEVTNPFIAPQVWSACGGVTGDISGAREVFAGLDLSETADLTAFVMVGKLDDDRWHVEPVFWLPEEGIAQKSVTDRVPYDMWAREGKMIACPGRTVSYEYVANFLADAVVRYKIKKIGFDRWNMRHLRPWLEKAGMSESLVKDKFAEFGQGWMSMSPAMRELEQALLQDKIRHGDHPVLQWCVANTIVVKDDAGNRKPSKRKSVGRIDGTVALIMAMGVTPMQPPRINVRALIG